MVINPHKATDLCLLVDDDPDILPLLERTLKKDFGIHSIKTNSINEAIQFIKTVPFALCLTDMQLPYEYNGKFQEDGGIQIVNALRQHAPETPIIVMTAYASLESTVQSLKEGAFDYISKPISIIKLRHTVSNALQATTSTFVENTEKREYVANNLIGDSLVIRKLRAQLETIAYAQIPVHITGESGVGKEVVARVIHRLSPCADKPFIAVNCSAISSDLMESEFFGHRKGSFTGAEKHKEGLFQAADGGILFLDEIGDLPQSMQAKLLRAIQEKKIRPVGSNQEIPIDVRILSATHRDLEALVKDGTFRGDLLYRIKVIELRVPPLRDRIEDIPLLASKILSEISRDFGLYSDFTLDPLAVGVLKTYPFFGNVRELRNILERAAAVCQSSQISLEDLELPAHNVVELPARQVEPILSNESIDSDLMLDELGISANSQSEPEDRDAALNELLKKYASMQLDEFLTEMEKAKISYAIEHNDKNLTTAAKTLGLSRSALRYRITRYGLNVKDSDE
jgi:two-component system response regulator PilR (NtrC family)